MEALLPLCETFRPRWAAVVDPEGARALEAALRARALPVEVLAGEEALVAIAASPRGRYGGCQGSSAARGSPAPTPRSPTAKRVLLANKEALVMTGALLTETAERTGAVLLPIDSEHNALFQCLASLVVRTPTAAGGWKQRSKRCGG